MPFRRLVPYLVLFLLVETLLRASLLARSLQDMELGAAELAAVAVKGAWLDLVCGAFFLVPLAAYQLLLPARRHGGALDRRVDAALRFLFCLVLLFDAVAEHLFWSEFTTRFNFIAVDYLVYTQEVIGNIAESYPLHWLFAGVAAGAALLTFASLRLMPLHAAPRAFVTRGFAFATVAAACGLLYALSNVGQARVGDNAEAGELAANGMYNLFYAYGHNEISYERFYATKPEAEVSRNARDLLWEKEAGFVHDDGRDLTRMVRAASAEKHRNVMLVVMESMGAEYMATFGNREKLTPNLDALAAKGLSFENAYATGTRTVRGLEAVTLSIPPTPGQSIVRRPGNDGLFSLGSVFRDRGYATQFVYGGYGYFDNMNAFFAGNGFDILDRTRMTGAETHFANVWGVCDEDMFARAVREGDRFHAAGKPFLQLVMTTSNHRPFTFPDGRIDLPSHSGRNGGVKYADYSIGKFIEEASTKPWFRDTVFVFVADHTAGAGGKAELDPRKYHIPMIFYAPGFIAPRRFEPIASQIDLGPVLLGLLDFSYYTKFYGEDLLHDDDEVPHAFISNYQKVGLIRNEGLTVLSPVRKVEHYGWPSVKADPTPEASAANDAVAYYQSASWWRKAYRSIPTVLR